MRRVSPGDIVDLGDEGVATVIDALSGQFFATTDDGRDVWRLYSDRSWSLVADGGGLPTTDDTLFGGDYD